MTKESKYNKLVEKWHNIFKENNLYESNPSPTKPKFFVNFPYPYINGYLHLGHAYTSLKADIISRLKRKKGYSVLFPQGFHATGQPILAAAERVKEGEKKQIDILKKMGIKDIERFSDPLEWIKYFSEKAYEHLNSFGYSIDWRRKFITTELNPAYDKFIRWQYKKLYEKGLIYKGSHPVVYCPKDKHAIGDHDRAEGEGVVPEKVVMIKFKLKDEDIHLISMTFRPETLWGVTNIWIREDATYVVYKTEKEKLLISKDVMESFAHQEIKGEVIKEIKGSELVGKEVINPINQKIVPILPAKFVDASSGSGIVMSVPAHAPYDYAALMDLKSTPWREFAEKVEMISLIEVKGYGNYPAKEICEKMNIKSQEEKDKLDKATKEIYKVEYHQGRLKDMFGSFKGLYVKDAKEKIIEMLKSKGVAFEFYILPEKVVCRCLTPGVVKILHDQWFIKYSDKRWKEEVKEHIKNMIFYPEEIRGNFIDTVDWLGDWAFTRERGLGTKFPYDEGKVIESLSDSTIYMAYYTISHYLENPEKYGIDVSKLKDTFFDYVFLGIGDKLQVGEENHIPAELLEKMREEFLYWYNGGFDIRISGKDLIKNHLTMMLFHHVAIFPPQHRPKSIGVNGFVMVDGEKMSKSKGNFYTIKDACELFGIEETRLALAYAGNIGIDDPNFETSMVREMREKLVWFENFIEKKYGSGREKEKEIDLWLLSKTKHLTDVFIESIEALDTREGIKYGFFEMQNILKRYLRRTLNQPHKEALKVFIEQQLHILSVIAPHYAQEMWNRIGKKSFIIEENFIELQEVEDSHEIIEFEEYLDNLIEDIKELKYLLERKGIKGKQLTIKVAEKWKYIAYDLIKGSENIKEVMEKAKQENYFDVSPKIFAEFINKNFAKIKRMKFNDLSREKEVEYLKENIEFLEHETGMKIAILEEDSTTEKKALPYKPSLVIK